MPKQISFVAEDETINLIEHLKKALGAPTTAAVFRKALALTKIAADQAKDSGGIVALKAHKADDSQAINIAINS